MSEHERTVTARVSPENAFRYLSSVSNLPSIVPHLRQIREEENDHVWGMAEMEGRKFEVSGFFRADEANRRLDWESDGTLGYRGWLTIEPAGADQSRITVHLSMRSVASETPPSQPGLAPERIEQKLDADIVKLRETLEREATVMA